MMVTVHGDDGSYGGDCAWEVYKAYIRLLASVQIPSMALGLWALYICGPVLRGVQARQTCYC